MARPRAPRVLVARRSSKARESSPEHLHLDRRQLPCSTDRTICMNNIHSGHHAFFNLGWVDVLFWKRRECCVCCCLAEHDKISILRDAESCGGCCRRSVQCLLACKELPEQCDCPTLDGFEHGHRKKIKNIKRCENI